MHLFKNILVVQSAYQPRSSSLGIAVHFAQLTGCSVKVVDVHYKRDAWWHEFVRDDPTSNQSDVSDRRERLNTIVDEADFPNDVKVKILEGRPIDMLVNEVQVGEHDLLLKEAESVSNGIFFGSLDMRLMRMSPAPLWVAKPNTPPKSRRVLAAIDPHPMEDGKLMNDRVIRSASMLARQEDADLFVVSAWNTPVASNEDNREEFERYKRLESRVQQLAWENVEHVINNSLLKIPADNVIFEHGSGVDAIVAAATSIQPDLLVMGSVSRTGVPGLLIGNTAEEVTRQIECSLLALKPDNFSFLLPSQLRA